VGNFSNDQKEEQNPECVAALLQLVSVEC